MDFPNPSSLGDIFNMNPGAFTQAQGILENMGQANQVGMQEQRRKLAYDTAADPFRLEQLRLGNETSQAHLPGIQAQSEQLQRKNANERLFNPDFIKEQQGKYSSAQLKRHIDDFENVGQLLRQGSAMVYDSPMGAGYKVKQMLKDAGYGDAWVPAFDQMPASTLSKALASMGNDIGDASTKYRNALGLIGAKGEFSKDIAETAAASREKIAASRAAAVKAAQDARASQSPKTLEAAFTAALSHAQTATDPEEKQAFIQIATEYQRQLQAMLQIKNQGAPGGIDTSKVTGLPPKPETVMPPITTSPTAPVVAPTGNKFPGIPNAAVDKLRSNPALAKAFDEKYGQGASATVLQGR